jgi:hypothetical protein
MANGITGKLEIYWFQQVYLQSGPYGCGFFSGVGGAVKL